MKFYDNIFITRNGVEEIQTKTLERIIGFFFIVTLLCILGC